MFPPDCFVKCFPLLVTTLVVLLLSLHWFIRAFVLLTCMAIFLFYMQAHQGSTWCWPVCATCTTMSRCSWFVHRDSHIEMTNKKRSEGVNMTEDGFLEDVFFTWKKCPESEAEWLGLNWVSVLALFTNEWCRFL